MLYQDFDHLRFVELVEENKPEDLKVFMEPSGSIEIEKGDWTIASDTSSTPYAFNQGVITFSVTKHTYDAPEVLEGAFDFNHIALPINFDQEMIKVVNDWFQLVRDILKLYVGK